MYLRWFKRGGWRVRETSESICEEKKTVTNEERFGYQRENDSDTDASYLDREGSRALLLLLLLLLSSLLTQSVRELFQRLRSRGDGRRRRRRRVPRGGASTHV